VYDTCITTAYDNFFKSNYVHNFKHLFIQLIILHIIIKCLNICCYIPIADTMRLTIKKNNILTITSHVLI